MKPYYEQDGITIYHGDSAEVLPTLGGGFTALVTDPPAGVGFMGKAWDADKGGRDAWIAWLGSVLGLARTQMLPGAPALVWALPRTSHWTGMACEAAGFDVRDRVTHLFGTGFPKSHNIGKALDKRRDDRDDILAVTGALAALWDGYGTALKPGGEDWWLCMNPIPSTFAANAEAHGVAGLNIDAARIGAGNDRAAGGKSGGRSGLYEDGFHQERHERPTGGRWPANVALSPGAAAALDEQTGDKGGGFGKQHPRHDGATWKEGSGFQNDGREFGYGDSGGPSRFFYCSKASRRERGEGNNHPTVKPLDLMRWLLSLVTYPERNLVLDPFLGSGSTALAALGSGLPFVGIEQSEEYCEIAARRIEAAAPEGLPLFSEFAA